MSRLPISQSLRNHAQTFLIFTHDHVPNHILAPTHPLRPQRPSPRPNFLPQPRSSIFLFYAPKNHNMAHAPNPTIRTTIPIHTSRTSQPPRSTTLGVPYRLGESTRDQTRAVKWCITAVTGVPSNYLGVAIPFTVFAVLQFIENEYWNRGERSCFTQEFPPKLSDSPISCATTATSFSLGGL
ncbi:hypothetical protein NX059_000838 [Plenodomus lindquistii]|nr:hypothetical protein NX059_000838 [Plenodomus lindquistii]